MTKKSLKETIARPPDKSEQMGVLTQYLLMPELLFYRQLKQKGEELRAKNGGDDPEAVNVQIYIRPSHFHCRICKNKRSGVKLLWHRW